jgi:phosphonate transport system substrate-binding protein
MNRFLLIAIIFMLFGLAPAWSQPVAKSVAPQKSARLVSKLVFGVIAPRGIETATKNWQPFAAAMSAKLKIPVEVIATADAKTIVDGFKQGEIDLAWLGNLTALEVVESGSGAVFAQMITKSGSTGYKSVLIVHKNSKIQTLADVLKPNSKLVFGDGEIKSTSGHLVPLYYAFVKNKINDPASLFREIKHANHGANMLSVAAKEVDIATGNNEELAFFAAERPDSHTQLRVIWTSPEIPQSPLVWSSGLAPTLKRQISKFVTTYGKKDDAERQVLAQVNDLSGFRWSSNAQLIRIADLEMFNERHKLWNNRELTPTDMAAREQQIIARASRLEIALRVLEKY